MRILAFLSLLCCFVLPDTSRAEQPGSAPCVGLCVTVQQAAGGDFRTVSTLECRIDTRACSGGGILMVEGQIVPVAIAGKFARGSLVLQMRGEGQAFAGGDDTDFFLMRLGAAPTQQQLFEFHRVPVWGSVRYQVEKPLPLIFRRLEPLGALRIVVQRSES